MYLTDGGNHFRVDQRIENEWMVRQIETNEIRRSPTYTLIKALQSGELREIGAPGSASEHMETVYPISNGAAFATSHAAIKTMKSIRRWIDELRDDGYHEISDNVWIRNAIDHLSKTRLFGVRQFAISTLQSTLAKVRKAGGDWSAVIPKYMNRGGRGKTRIDHRVEKIIQEVLAPYKGNHEENEVNGEGPFVRSHVIDSIRSRVLEHNLLAPEDPILMPGESTIDRRIAKQITKYDRHVRKSGRSSANRLYRENSYPRDTAQFPLEISEYDDIDCGVFLINQRIRLPVGRAYLTHGIDNKTAVPLGFDLSHKARSFDSAIGAICSSLLPKDPSQPEFGAMASAWIGYGTQGTMLLDNARYNQSQSTNTAADDASLVLAWTRPRAPTEKCSIEHYNFLVKQDFCSILPGWRGDKSDADSVKFGMSNSCIDVIQFKVMYVKWVTGVYLNNPGEDGYTPKQRWERYFHSHSPAVRWTKDQIALLRLRPMELRFRASGGLKRLGLVYNSDAIAELRRDIGYRAIVLVYVDDDNLNFILVRHPHTFELLKANYVGDPEYVKGLSAYQQRLILQQARERGTKNPAIIDMVRNREALQLMVEQARLSRKLSERRWAERVGNVPSASTEFGLNVVSDATDSTPTQNVKRVMTDLEWSIVQLEQVELSAGDLEW